MEKKAIFRVLVPDLLSGNGMSSLLEMCQRTRTIRRTNLVEPFSALFHACPGRH